MFFYARSAANRTACSGSAYGLGFALLTYHDSQGHFPSPVIYDDNGKALHSWRTELLRIVYPQYVAGYDFDAPWDSAQNLQFAAENVPPWFHCPSDSSTSMTSYVLLVGEHCLFKNTRDQPKIDDISQEATLLMEVADSKILWSEPKDAECNDQGCLPSCGLHAAKPVAHRGRAVAVMISGSGDIRLQRGE